MFNLDRGDAQRDRRSRNPCRELYVEGDELLAVGRGGGDRAAAFASSQEQFESPISFPDGTDAACGPNGVAAAIARRRRRSLAWCGNSSAARRQAAEIDSRTVRSCGVDAVYGGSLDHFHPPM